MQIDEGPHAQLCSELVRRIKFKLQHHTLFSRLRLSRCFASSSTLTMKTYPVMFSAICSFFLALGTALPKLVARQGGCESVVCWPDLSDGSNIPSSLWGLWQLFQGGESIAEPPPDDTDTNWNTPGSVFVPEQDPLEIYVTAPQTKCDANQAFDSQALPGGTGPNTCEVATGLLGWPRDCTDAGENTRVEEILRKKDPKTLTSTDPLCQLKDGVNFWITTATQQSVESLRRQFPGLVVTPNLPYKKPYGGPTSHSSNPIQIPAANGKSHKNKRDGLVVEKQILRPVSVQDPSLTFLSTPPGEPNLDDKYAYFAQGGEGVTVYVMGSGLDLASYEEYWLTPGWIFAVDVPETTTDEEERGHGSCMVSKIGGIMFGVAKKPQLEIVKTTNTIGSFINALGRVQRDIFKNRADEVVVYMPHNWNTPDDQDENAIGVAMKRLLWSLVQSEVVIIVDAGGAQPGDIESVGIPAAFSLQYDIITVGAVEAGYGSTSAPHTHYGAKPEWSRGEKAITVRAPGNGICSQKARSWGDWGGDGFAGAVVTGLVAYFLSIPVLNNAFRAERSLPKAVRNYLLKMSYERYPGQASVWNGLNSKDTFGVIDHTLWLGWPSRQNPLWPPHQGSRASST